MILASEDLLFLIIPLGFTIIWLGILIYMFYQKNRFNKFLVVKGKCVEIKVVGDFKCPVFEIAWNGEKMEITSNVFKETTPFQVDKEYDLRVNPQDPKDFFSDQKFVYDNYIFVLLIGSFFGPALLTFYLGEKVFLTTLFLTLAILFGWLFIKNLEEYIKKIKTCTVKLPATVVDVQTSVDRDSDSGVTYHHIITYKIQYNGQEYIISNEVATIKSAIVGSIINIKINPNNLDEFIDSRWLFYTLLGMIIPAVVLLIILYTFFVRVI